MSVQSEVREALKIPKIVEVRKIFDGFEGFEGVEGFEGFEVTPRFRSDAKKLQGFEVMQKNSKVSKVSK